MELPSFEESLDEWVELQAPTSQETGFYRKELERVVHLLKTDGENLGVNRVRLLGSATYGTNVKGSCDGDIIVFVDREPPYHNKIEELKSVVSTIYHHQENVLAQLVLDQHGAIAVTLKHGLRFNIFLAKNFLKHEEKRLEDKAQEKRQYERSIEWLRQFRNQPPKLLAYSSFLSPTATHFIASQVKDRHVVELIRLCKKWNESIVGLPYIHKRSSTIELLAIVATSQEKRMKRLVGGFRHFLENWLEIATGAFYRHFEYSEKHELYYLRDVAPALRDERPLLLDPVDPFNNRLKPFKDAGALPAFRFCAENTLQRLYAAESKGLTSFDHVFAKQNVSAMFSKA